MGLFSKPEPKKPTPTPTVKRTNPEPATPPAAATLIGAEAQIKGELISSDNILIEGRVEGKVKGTKQIIIGEKGQVQAEIEAQIVSIRGKLQGDCVASTKVEITGTGKVFGNITAPRIAVAEGAVFRGASNMTVEQKPLGPKPPEVRKPEPPKTDGPPRTGGPQTAPSPGSSPNVQSSTGNEKKPY